MNLKRQPPKDLNGYYVDLNNEIRINPVPKKQFIMAWKEKGERNDEEKMDSSVIAHIMCVSCDFMR